MISVGITGHQEREGINWSWVEACLSRELDNINDIRKAYSSLAKGADQLFAREVLRRGIPLYAILPVTGYRDYFDQKNVLEYEALLAESSIIQLKRDGSIEEAFYKAGQYIVDHSSILIAIWDGEEAEGFGGTADVVKYAQSVDCRIIHINPIDLMVN